MKPVEVKLVNYTQDAMDTLIYTKSTRLEQGEETRNKIAAMTKEEKAHEITYMANTVPSSWEFVNYVFEIRNVTRAFTHQLVRTRTGSYAQQAMRIANMKKFSYRIPQRLKEPGMDDMLEEYQAGMQEIQYRYDVMVAAGVNIEDARGLLPTNIHTNIIAQFNLRAFSDLVKKRQGMRVQGEYRQVLDGMLECVLGVHPWAEKFIMPKANSNIKELEAFIENMLVVGKIDKAQSLTLHKNLDKIRQGGS